MQNQRRTFLKIMAATPLAACSGGGSGGSASFGDVPAGNASATSDGTLSVVPNAPAILGRDAGGLYAMTIICTHQGCDVAPAGNGLRCPCHGSRYDSVGKVLQGPASAPLVHFALSLDAAGNITIHGGTQVAANVRTPVG